jgi:hypothetical protein
MEDKTVLERANAALAEAREVLRKADENLEKTKTIHDSTLRQSREIAYALSCLSAPMLAAQPLSEAEEQELQEKLKSMHSNFQPIFVSGLCHGVVESRVESKKKRDVFDVIHSINELAMLNTHLIHVTTVFVAGIDSFEVMAYVITDEAEIDPPYLMKELVGIYKDGSLEKLLSVESQLSEIIINIREEAEAKAEVDA